MTSTYLLKRPDKIYTDAAVDSPFVMLRPKDEFDYSGQGGKITGHEVYLKTKDSLVRAVKIGNNRYILWGSISKKLENTSSMAGIEIPMPSELMSGFNARTMDGINAAVAHKKELTEAEARELHKKSGSKKPFSEWAKSDGAKSLGAFVGGVFAGIAQNKAGSTNNTSNTNNSGNSRGNESKNILGMPPLVFAIVSLLTIGAGVTGFILMSRNNK
jgi:hypothetical protein